MFVPANHAVFPVFVHLCTRVTVYHAGTIRPFCIKMVWFYLIEIIRTCYLDIFMDFIWTECMSI